MGLTRWSNPSLSIFAALRFVRDALARRHAQASAVREPTVRDALLKIAAMELAILAATGPLTTSGRLAGGGRGSFPSLGSGWVARIQSDAALGHRAIDLTAIAICPVLEYHRAFEGGRGQEEAVFLPDDLACRLKESEAIDFQGRWRLACRLLAAVRQNLPRPLVAGREALGRLQAVASLNALAVRLQVCFFSLASVRHRSRSPRRVGRCVFSRHF
jgi:hypothetical protein